jgi:hypothetical protein
MATEEKILRALARLLPRDFRERVFEPALADLRRDSLRRTPWRQRCAQLLFAVECLRLGAARHVWHRGRFTRLGTAVLAILLVSALVIQRLNYGATRLAAVHEVAPSDAATQSTTPHR